MTRSAADVESAADPPDERDRAPVVAVLVAAVVIAVTAAVGGWLAVGGVDLHLLGGTVLRGRYDVHLDPAVAFPVAVGLAGVLWGPALARWAPWGALLPGSAGAAALWAVALAVSGGWHRLTEPLASRYEYPYDVDRVGALGPFLATFNDHVPAASADPWTTHVSGHPPAALLAFVLLDRTGLGGLGWAAALCIAVGALAVPAVLVAVRTVADEPTARTVAPFAVLAPTALWIATSADAIFAGVAAWGVAALAVAAARERRRAPWAVGGGLLLGLALFLSFGLTSLGLLALAVVVVQWRAIGRAGVVQVLVLGAVGVLVVFAAFAAGGYNWFDGLSVTADRVRSGPSYTDRPLAFFLVANLAAAAIAAGPAAVAGLGALRRRALALLPAAVVAGMLVSDLTGLVRGETERIWLPFTVWLAAATAFLPARQRRGWLAAAVVVALVVEVTVRTEW
ncbi:hypothetical protein SAMN04515665_10540 [Blastococcus sp. DSM 46786]|uniref:hypothetical protein n=1 Tax=Blastococcus sp. DSM 46786 TaxID=1798227 RepID=UPI0008B5CD07|nr:hypothetical protein [Blastococcus sp. DSM 46786]SEK78284.1 hypothetical protein SAMN04515665_10540 [Blastococcus sp. DSM 46786]